MHLLKEHVPCQCTNSKCGAAFQHGGLVGGSGSVTMTGCSTVCPYCGSSAKILDGQMTSGIYKTKELFRFIRDISDEEKLIRLSRVLEAASDKTTPEELTHELSSIDFGFNKFSALLKSIPFDKRIIILNTLLTFILVLISTLQFAKEDPLDRLVEIEEARFEREQNEIKDAEIENKGFDEKIKILEEKFEELLNQKDKIEKKKPVKGSLRNKDCPCGSKKKTKCCHPYWPNGSVSA